MFSFFWLIILWIREAVVGFFRNFGWNVAALFLTVFCLLGFSISFVAGENAKFFAEELGDKVEIQIDLNDELLLTQHNDIREKLKGLPESKEVRYISEEETYQKVKTEMGKDSDILEILDENPFPARFVVKLENPEQVESVVNEIETWNISSSIQFGEGYIEKLLTITEAVSKIGYIITLVVALATIYIVSSVIKFNVDQRKEEIKIKQLTGTGMFTIRFPFVLEALIITGISSLVVFLAFYFGYEKAMVQVNSMVPYIKTVEANIIVQEITQWIFLLALSIGIIGSLLSTTRNLEKV